jgi:hypothetical protein
MKEFAQCIKDYGFEVVIIDRFTSRWTAKTRGMCTRWANSFEPSAYRSSKPERRRFSFTIR